ncbi:hypothetical protein H311_02448 [Anncaliia algerae PRA109]|nr:hypothetical protein H311_02448 [Anncaliia algerae PRA109]
MYITNLQSSSNNIHMLYRTSDLSKISRHCPRCIHDVSDHVPYKRKRTYTYTLDDINTLDFECNERKSDHSKDNEVNIRTDLDSSMGIEYLEEHAPSLQSESTEISSLEISNSPNNYHSNISYHDLDTFNDIDDVKNIISEKLFKIRNLIEENEKNNEYNDNLKNHFGVNALNQKNFDELCVLNRNNIVVINYHCCYSKSRTCSYISNIFDGNSCSKASIKNRCLQLWFDKERIHKKNANIAKIDVKEFENRLRLYLKSNFKQRVLSLGKKQMELAIDRAIVRLKRNKVSILFFFTVLFLRMQSLKHNSFKMYHGGNTFNLFENIYNEEIDVIKSIYKSLEWWSHIYFEKNNVEMGIFTVFNIVFRNFFVFNVANPGHSKFLFSYAKVIFKSLSIIHE